MTPKQLEGIGRRLFGKEWQSPMARHVKRHRLTIRRWLKGDTPIPADIAKILMNLDTALKLERFKFDTSGYIHLTPISKLRNELWRNRRKE